MDFGLNVVLFFVGQMALPNPARKDPHVSETAPADISTTA
jgi:hypothetical protein